MFVDFCFCAALLSSVFIVLAFRPCVIHVRSAGRPHFLYSKSLFFSSGPSPLLLSYFLLCLGRTAADCPASKIMGGGGGGDAMIFAAAQAIFWPTRVFGLCFGWLFVLTRFTCGNRGKFHVLVFNLRVPPTANRHVCITAFCLRC